MKQQTLAIISLNACQLNSCTFYLWCRGLTTWLLHVGSPFGNRLLNNSWAVGLTQWIVYLHFCCILTYAIIYVFIHHKVVLLHLYFLNTLYFFSSTHVLTSSIDVVLVLSIWPLTCLFSLILHFLFLFNSFSFLHLADLDYQMCFILIINCEILKSSKTSILSHIRRYGNKQSSCN